MCVCVCTCVVLCTCVCVCKNMCWAEIWIRWGESGRGEEVIGKSGKGRTARMPFIILPFIIFLLIFRFAQLYIKCTADSTQSS